MASSTGAPGCPPLGQDRVRKLSSELSSGARRRRRSASHRSAMASDALFLGNLPWDVCPETVCKVVREACEAHGRVEAVKVAQFGTGRHRRRRRDLGKLHHGHAHVRFSSNEDAGKAYKELQGSLEMHSPRGMTQVVVEMAIKPPERPPTEEEVQRREVQSMALQMQREHNRRQRKRRIGRHWEHVEVVVEKIGPPGGVHATNAYADPTQLGLDLNEAKLDWSTVPAACDPQIGGGLGTADGCETIRSRRKREQTEGFARILGKLAAGRSGLRIVDFGSGSGNMTLPLAYLFPEHHFVAIDMKDKSIALLEAKAREAGIGNLQGQVGMIETYEDAFDIGLALHACGNATDHAMKKAMRNTAAFVVSPCCVGKLKYSLKGGSSFSECWREYEDWDKALKQKKSELESRAPPSVDELQHPASRWMRSCLSEEEFEVLAGYADFHAEARPIQRLCKLNVEIDRAKGAEEAGYLTCIVKLTREESYPKNDCIIGVHPNGAACIDWICAGEMLR